MSTVRILCLDDPEPGIPEDLARFVTGLFDLEARVEPARVDLDSAFDPARRQYESTAILRLLLTRVTPEGGRVLGVTDRDLFIPMLSFLFGHAQVDGPAALVSLARLRQEFYGLPPSAELLRERLHKEAAHELGHTCGLRHCNTPSCCMSLSTSIEYVDRKRPRFCPGCHALVREHLARQRVSALPIEETKEGLP